MLQRVQTLFMLGTAGVMIALLFTPLWSEVNSQTQQTVQLTAWEMTQTTTDGTVEQSQSTFYIGIVAIASALVAFISIFRYNNRLTQMKLNFLNTLLIAGTVALSLYFAFEGEKWLLPEQPGAWKAGLFLPPVALLCNSIANRFIRRDENLVRSVDRLR